jgi:prepilin-type N-terminal cleavage/methylation domain-containing protein
MTRLRAQEGFTLPEVLIASVIGFIVLAATMGLLTSTLRLGSGISAKTDAMQRGRVALDTMTQQLRSQVCLNRDNPAVLAHGTNGAVSNENAVTFYADFSDGSGDTPPMKRRLEFDAATNSIRHYSYTTTVTPPTAVSWPAQPNRAGVVLENAALQPGKPFLTYYAYQRVDGEPSPVYQELPPPLSTAEAARVARIDLSFAARPTGVRDAARHAVNVNDRVLVRHADPNLKVPDPACT